MPRYFFHLDADELLTDPDGLELACETAAQIQAIEMAQEVAEAAKADDRLDLNHAIVVHDDAGQTVAYVSLAEAIQTSC